MLLMDLGVGTGMLIYYLNMSFPKMGIPKGRPGNNSWLTGILGFNSKIFFESAVVATKETVPNKRKNAKFYY